MTVIPAEARRYMTLEASGHTTWRGRKYYGRPAWTLWMQRAVWEETFGVIPPKSTVNSVCDTIGCLTPSHLKITTRKPRVLVTQCKNCGGILSRDKNNKTFCVLCLKNKARTRRAGEKLNAI